MTRRGYNTDPPIYFGYPGAYVTLPWPKGGLGAPVDRTVFDFTNGVGGHQVSTLVGTSRSYALSWTALHQSTFDLVSMYAYGHQGVGPFAIIDPSRPNLLTPNQSSATSVWHDTTDLLLGSTHQGVISSNTNPTWYHRPLGRRSIKWTGFIGTLDATAIITPTLPYFAWFGTPVVAGLPYVFYYWATPDPATDVSVTMDCQIVWKNSAGGVISTTSLGATAVTAWHQMIASGIAPAGAAFAVPQVVLTTSSCTTATVIYVDEMNFEQTDTVHDWAPGTGCAAVGITGWTENVPFDAEFRLGPVLNLRELTP